jgi:endogenous inhibitor of DNA gyrase (YacG/DUF329 family)
MDNERQQLHCPDCGKEVPSLKRDCTHCGRIVDTSESSSPAAPDPADSSPLQRDLWLKIYSYFVLPVILVTLLVMAVDALYSSRPLSLAYHSILFLFVGITFYALLRRSSFGWKCNIGVLLVTAILLPLGFENISAGLLDPGTPFTSGLSLYLTSVLAGYILWFLPNYYYFKRRRNTFIYYISLRPPLPVMVLLVFGFLLLAYHVVTTERLLSNIPLLDPLRARVSAWRGEVDGSLEVESVRSKISSLAAPPDKSRATTAPVLLSTGQRVVAVETMDDSLAPGDEVEILWKNEDGTIWLRLIDRTFQVTGVSRQRVTIMVTGAEAEEISSAAAKGKVYASRR